MIYIELDDIAEVRESKAYHVLVAKLAELTTSTIREREGFYVVHVEDVVTAMAEAQAVIDAPSVLDA
jgi:hypothetical protein